MKISVDREKFLKALQRVSSIIGARSMLPLLGNVKLEAVSGSLRLTTTDLEIRITTGTEAQVEAEGCTTAPAKKLLALVSRFTDGTVSLESDDQNRIQIACGTGHFTLRGLPAAEFPVAAEFESVRQIRIQEKDFKSMLNSISYAVSPDDSRKVLTGVLLNVKGASATLVATDGKRLAMQEKTPEGIEGGDGESIIPLKAANEVRRLLEGSGSLTISVGSKQCRFEAANFVLDSKLIEGKYPDYLKVIPASFRQTLDIPVAPLLAKVEMVSQVLSDSGSYVILDFEPGKLTIRASSSEVGEGSDELPVNFDGEATSVSFNPVYLADPLRAASADEVKFKMNDSFNPIAMECGEGFLCVVMPIRKNQ